MQFYQCPNCGRKYSEFENKFYCGTCNYRLLKTEDIKSIKNPEISRRKYSIIGEIQDQTKPTITCPYCQSTNTKKITNTSKAIHTAVFGIFSIGRNSRNYHCNNCKSDF